MYYVTLSACSTFFLGLFYRSARLYHPQRRAILHLKTQKRKIKEKNRQANRTSFFDFKTLRSQTVRIILISSAFSAFGIYIPIVHLAQTVKNDKLIDVDMALQLNMGLGFILGTIVFGVLVIRNNAECRIGRQYLCQVSSFMCAICLLALTKIHSNYEGYVIVVWTYGIVAFSSFGYSILINFVFSCIFIFPFFLFIIFPVLFRFLLWRISLFIKSLFIRTCSCKEFSTSMEFSTMRAINTNCCWHQFGRVSQRSRIT